MRKLSLLVCLLLTIGYDCVSQTSEIRPTEYQLGSRTVYIPKPEGFTDTADNFFGVSARLRATEYSENETVSTYVSDALVPRLKANEDIDLDFYAKISVGRSVKTTDMSQQQYRNIVAAFEKDFSAYIQPGSAFMNKVQNEAGQKLSDFWGRDANFTLNKPKNLGYFQKTPGVFSVLMLNSVNAFGKKYLVLTAASLVYVHRRLLYVYGFKMLKDKADSATLTAFQKNWTTAIVEANR
jgi:hypothetical protein